MKTSYASSSFLLHVVLSILTQSTLLPYALFLLLFLLSLFLYYCSDNVVKWLQKIYINV